MEMTVQTTSQTIKDIISSSDQLHKQSIPGTLVIKTVLCLLHVIV